MSRNIKMLFVVMLSLVLVFSTALLVSAHPNKQDEILKSEYHSKYGRYYVGGESVGWSIDENNHNGTSNIFYTWKAGDNCLTDARKNTFLQGAAKWAPCGSVSEDPTGGGNTYQAGKIGTFDGSASTVVAKFYDYTSDSDGHLYRWKIDMNWRKNVTGVTMTHELGHAFGLNDLYDDSNSNKLMYGYTSRKATKPMPEDIKGFQVITGKHQSHSFNSSGVCTVCGGLKK